MVRAKVGGDRVFRDFLNLTTLNGGCCLKLASGGTGDLEESWWKCCFCHTLTNY